MELDVIIKQAVDAAVKSECERCIAWVQHARSRGETDHRQIIHWIEGGERPDEDAYEG